LKLHEKRQTWVPEPHFGEVRGDARPWLMALWKAHGRLSIHLGRTSFTVCHGSWVIKQNVYSSAVFTGGRPLCTEILPGQGRPPSTIIGIRKLDTMGYRRWRLHDNFDTILECDGQTEVQTDLP